MLCPICKNELHITGAGIETAVEAGVLKVYNKQTLHCKNPACTGHSATVRHLLHPLPTPEQESE